MTVIANPLHALFGAEELICPYTGLRTFTEDEAIYFRGRESHVAKCLTLLAERRFVMITGASGDGKSSLVFAGLLPEVRAGFLRGRYSSWTVATFRPERSPLRNLAQALATALQLESSAAAVETELEQGFSALVQLYRASPLCPPAELPEGLTSIEKRHHQRKASNLLLVVDQFEEFFTNPENYTKDGPNAAAQTVVNLLLETTRLAEAENLPIYIVCTMRSDFVGQCAEFRGLIEQIGASQYFVPRLLRHEFVEVIREPALLSGNRISERLVQRLLYDIRHGQDQLPVLQHALRRIWLAADQGREEMDLIHYAMVGGMSDELPPTEQARFAQWRATVPEAEQQFLLADASLRNVLDAHANQLYFDATALYNQAFEPALPPGTAERVIAQTFRVLTRADGQRVVRNRLTGAEITAILNEPALPWSVVCRILQPFRQPGNTFLSPFIGEDEDDKTVLPPDTVLDITHESLIRNWNHLSKWAQAEAGDVRVAEDFIQQANRWQENDKDSGFLLPIGPYTYFSEWSRRKKSLSSWLAHYVGTGQSTNSKAATRHIPAEAQTAVLARFLAASRRRLAFQLLVARHGAGRLLAVVLLPVLLVGLGWWAWSVRQQQGDYVAYSIIKERIPFLKSSYVGVDDKARFLLHTDRLKNVVYRPWLGGRSAADYSFPRMLDALADDSLALDIELSMYSWVNNIDYDSVARENPCLQTLLFDLDRRLDQAAHRAQCPKPRFINTPQRSQAVYTALAVMAITHYLLSAEQQKAVVVQPLKVRQAASQRLEANKRKLLRRLYAYVQQEVRQTAGPAPSPVDFGLCLRVLLGQGNYQPAEVAFLEGLSPFGSAAARRQFNRIFPPQLKLLANEGQSSTAHSGGYLSSAIVFAARRQSDRVVQCLDSLSTRANRPNTRDGGIAVLPYLIKYELLTPENTLNLLRHCSRIGGGSFNKTYAATIYSLLSVSPSYAVYDVNPSFGKAYAADEARAGAINPDYLNSDRVSFSVSVAARDKAWQALLEAAPLVAAGEPLFTEQSEHTFYAHPITAVKYRRNSLFLRAFLAKTYGVYLREVKHQPRESAEAFAQFSTHLLALKQACQPYEMVSIAEWNLGISEMVDNNFTTTQSPITFLQVPSRPKTLLFEPYYTCSFDSFFTYQLRHEAAQPVVNPGLVQLLDSVAFAEAAFPDRFSGTRGKYLRAAALSRLRQDLPNLVWIKALAQVPLPGTAARQQRNNILITVSAALQSPARLQQMLITPALLSFVTNLADQPSFSREPLQVAFSDLATELAYAGRIPEAFALADALGEPMTTISKIRISEQAVLVNNQSHRVLVDNFLAHYQQRISSKPLSAAASVISVLYWRPYANDQRASDFQQFASFLIKEGNSTVNNQGQLAMCKGRSFADHAYEAVRDIPAYKSERFRQPYFNAVLLGLAHLKTTARGDGWREYDEVELVYPKDYIGPGN